MRIALRSAQRGHTQITHLNLGRFRKVRSILATSTPLDCTITLTHDFYLTLTLENFGKVRSILDTSTTLNCPTTLTHDLYLKPSRMSQFMRDSSTGSSNSSFSSSSDSESDLDFDVVRPKAVKFNEAGPQAQSSNTEKETEGGSKEKKATGKANKTNKQANTGKDQEAQKEKLTPERTVLLLKKIIGSYKKRATKDKKKFSKVLRSASAAARKYKLILNKVTKKAI